MNNLTESMELPSLTKAGLAELLAEKMGVSGRESHELVNSFFELVLEQLCQGHKVKLAGFGTFEVQMKAARPGRNPRTGKSAVISPRQVAKFSSGPKLEKRMATPKRTEPTRRTQGQERYALHEIAHAPPPHNQAELAR